MSSKGDAGLLGLKTVKDAERCLPAVDRPFISGNLSV